MDKVAALREFRVLHTALHSSSSYREAVSVCQGPLPETLARPAGEGVNAGEWCRVGAGSLLPWLPRVPRGLFAVSVGLSRTLSSPKEALS